MDADVVVGFLAGLLIALVTAPVGVSGAVFLLPVQLSVLHVPNPAVTPTNLLYNVIAGPGALLRYYRKGQLTGDLGGRLARRLLAGTVPGVIVGATVRVLLLPGAKTFRLVAGVVLLGIGLWLLTRIIRPPRPGPELSNLTIVAIAFAVGTIGGIYGIGGGSILSPILVGSGIAVGIVAPAALASTFVTSIVGAGTYVVLGMAVEGSIAPSWSVGIACGLGGLVGGYAGARAQPHLPERFLRVILGLLACGVGVLYLYQGHS